MTHAPTATDLRPFAPPDLLTVPEVARVMRVDPVTLRRWIKTGGVRGTKLGRTWRISRAELDHVLAHGVRK
jgi:excisionase family DNA binding protein